VYELIQLLV